MVSLLARCGLERSLGIIENTIAIDSAALEVAMVIVSDHDNLLACLHLLDDFKVGPVKDLDVTLVQSYQYESIIAESVIDLELSRNLLFKFKLISCEEVKLHL